MKLKTFPHEVVIIILKSHKYNEYAITNTNCLVYTVCLKMLSLKLV